jgi:hypothetical protein
VDPVGVESEIGIGGHRRHCEIIGSASQIDRLRAHQYCRRRLRSERLHGIK